MAEISPGHPCPQEDTQTASAPLTELQRMTLKRLNELRWRRPVGQMGGFNPCSFGGERYAASARGLASRGLVRMDRISERHIRYAITPAGMVAVERLVP